MFTQHHRYLIHNGNQHPYRHSLTEFLYSHPSLPPGEVINVEQAINWLFGVIYPQTQDAVATPAALPLAGNTLNDYRVVLDDGDGKAASYRWEQREGDVAPLWYKIYDMDWGEDSILSNFLLKTQDVYVYRFGVDDLDETGTPFAGDLAGQRIYGGATAGTHLLLYANSGDGTGPNTGFIQFGDDSRPLVDSSVSLGTDLYRFLNFFTDEANVSTMQILGGSIIDSTGSIDFSTNNLSTDGTVSVGTLLLAGGSITDGSGLIDFDDENLTTTGTVTADNVQALGSASAFFSGTTIGTLTLGDGSIVDSGGLIDFDDENLTTTGIGTFGQVDVDNLSLDGNTFSSSAGNIIVVPFADLLVNANTFITGDLDVSGQVVIGPADDLEITATTFISENAFTFSTIAGDINIDPFTEVANFVATVKPNVDDTYDLGLPATRWQDLFLSGVIGDGTNTTDISVIMSLRDILVGVGAGDSIFYDGTKFVSSAPDTEIDHGVISGLADDDHLQYALLAGRNGGQTLIGDSAASGNLVLESTSNATKGHVRFASNLVPNADATFDIGTSGLRVGDLYIAGQGIGFRLENTTSGGLPAASASNVGRITWATDINQMYVDTGGTWKKLTSDKHVVQDAVNWDGVNTSHPYDVSADVDDARFAVWDFLDNTNSFRSVQGAVLTKTATTVTVTFTIPPASGTYTLVGVA